MLATLDIFNVGINILHAKKSTILLDKFYGHAYILLRPGPSRVDRGFRLIIAGKEYNSRTMLRLGGSSPNVLIVVDVRDIRNIQFS